MKPLRDFDSAERATRLAIAAWSLAGALIGGLLGSFVALSGRVPAALAVVGCALVGAVAVYILAAVIGERAGDALASLFAPGRRDARPAVRLSLAESLVARGRYREAAAEYRREAERVPDAPEPCLRLARLHRDRLEDPEGALLWFRQARSIATDPGEELLAVRELVDLYERCLGEPARALPELARFADRHAGTAGAEWAQRELARIRSTSFE